MSYKDESGQGFVEYALIVVLILVAIVGMRWLANVAYDAWLLSGQVGRATLNIENRVDFLLERKATLAEIQDNLTGKVKTRLELDYAFQTDGVEVIYSVTKIEVVIPAGTRHKGVFSERRWTRTRFVYTVFLSP